MLTAAVGSALGDSSSTAMGNALGAARAAADTAVSGSTTGWVIGYVIAIVVVLVVVALVVPILWMARSIGNEAGMIDDALRQSVRNTAALAQLRTTIDSAEKIAAGLERGRHRLGG